MVQKSSPVLVGIIGILASMLTLCDSARIHKYVYNNNGLGVYSFEYEASDGSYRREEGGQSPETNSLAVRGEFRYIDPSGKLYSLQYIADENGYRPLAEEDTRFNDRNIL